MFFKVRASNEHEEVNSWWGGTNEHLKDCFHSRLCACNHAYAICCAGARIGSGQATKLPFNQSAQIPGGVLPAGTYWFTRAGTFRGEGNVIQIFNSDLTKLCATSIAISILCAKGIDKTEFIFIEAPGRFTALVPICSLKICCW